MKVYMLGLTAACEEYTKRSSNLQVRSIRVQRYTVVLIVYVANAECSTKKDTHAQLPTRKICHITLFSE